MPHSLVLNLLPQSPIYPAYLSGRHLHALFLTLVSSVDKTLGDRLHASIADKAFTLSPLQANKSKHNLQWEHQQPIPAGTPCWWRISLLDDTLFSKLTQLWLNLNPKHPWHLGSADLYITSILGTPQSTQPWANATTYAQLYEQASDSEREVAFRFYTPTCFRQGEFDAALPTRECVFNSLLNRWQKYSGIEFEPNLTPVIFPSYFNISTTMVADSRSKFIGCIGEITYRILGEFDPIIIKQINALADFALYCGAGRKTTMGMGMLRRIRITKK
ncbi:CRISPR-associated endoribonuclease Cas6 [Gloeocapsopsis dulcis]|uniref:CRISPR-associated endoribonuclease Cas6 n=1 Tax=Gloeocapsopsis dulcis AAB1 = 1H9 TaxID=1433147 RepID=A0A6N8FR05_9CHRO|nr:CRISPR-associated endoribonuclease Cas6 [Gloeocapsopsis dulcis]MUL35339.1 CRISPR-associated endoribonuclease Cas6 [Gloeocapsopsis dulcis AAB1 = 1H9]WNN90459.1 CRISPR-associated endoribonuclease Cas6 [Gloeocapsopsis dulcis]